MHITTLFILGILPYHKVSIYTVTRHVKYE